MASDYRYAVKRGNRWLQGIEPNEKYCWSGTAPTMGNRHTHSEYKTVWGTEQKLFEKMTAANYIKTLMEEYRWGDKSPMKFQIIPVLNGGKI